MAVILFVLKLKKGKMRGLKLKCCGSPENFTRFVDTHITQKTQNMFLSSWVAGLFNWKHKYFEATKACDKEQS